jgi:hypothetical protein
MRKRMIPLLALLIVIGVAAFAIEAFKVRSVSASVSEPEYRGSCPHRFEFTGRITTNREGTVRYRWLRSDGSAYPEKTLAFAAAGTKTVSDYWELGGVMGTYRDRWMRIEILAPNSLLSNKALFDLECIPQVQMERKFYTVSGRLISYATQHPFLEALAGCQLKVRLAGGGRTIKEQVVDLDTDGFASYALVLINAPGTYQLTVEPVRLSERMRWQRSDPVSYTVVLTEDSPTANNKNFTYYYALTGML